MSKKTKQAVYFGLKIRCIEMYQKGQSQKKMVEALGVNQGTISRWIKAYLSEGEKSLEPVKVGGSNRKITKEQEAELREILILGAEKSGYEGDFWTRKRVGEIVNDRYKIKYKVSAIGKILLGMGFSYQKPQTKHYKQDESKIKEWKETRLPALKKKQKKKDM